MNDSIRQQIEALAMPTVRRRYRGFDSAHALGIVLDKGNSTEITITATSHAIERAAERHGEPFVAADLVTFKPTTKVRDALRLWTDASGRGLMVTESEGRGWVMLTVVTALASDQAATDMTIRPYRRSRIPEWFASVDLAAALDHGEIVAVLIDKPRTTVDDLASCVVTPVRFSRRWTGCTVLGLSHTSAVSLGQVGAPRGRSLTPCRSARPCPRGSMSTNFGASWLRSASARLRF